MIKQPARWNTNMENWVDLIIWGKDYKWFVDKKHGDLDKNGQREISDSGVRPRMHE